MSLEIYVNTGTQDVEVGESGGEWVELDTTNDKLIFSAGNPSVADGQPSPSVTQLNSAGVRLGTGSDVTISKYFLDDNSAGILKQIHNMGAGNYRYVLGFSFDAETASEPVLEVWDDSDLDSIDSVILGAGTPSSSWIRGITTTDSAPGVAWTGSRLAGSGDGYFLYLNNENGALSGADILYCQLKIIVPSTQLTAISGQPVFAVKFASAA